MSRQIHSTAVIASGAEIGDNCVIGPYCVIGDRVRIGPGTRLHSHVAVEGSTMIGTECEIFPFAAIGGQTQDLKYRGGESFVEIGDHTTLREYVTVNAATGEGARTVVGSHCHILAYCHIAHDCRLGDGVIMSNNTQLAGHVVVEDRAVFGGMGGVHQFVRIGTLAMVSGMARVGQDVAPYCLAAGIPAGAVTINRIGMERNGFKKASIAAVARAYRILFRSSLPVAEAVERLRREFADVPEVQHLAEFAESSERGLARPKGHVES